jgi:hypothetical protein
MFSSSGAEDKDVSPVSPSSTTSSSSAYSPYSPAARHRRSSSAATLIHQQQDSLPANSPLNLQESLLEFSQLQDRIKKEQELLLDSRLSIDIQAFGGSGSFAGQSGAADAASMLCSSSAGGSARPREPQQQPPLMFADARMSGKEEGSMFEPVKSSFASQGAFAATSPLAGCSVPPVAAASIQLSDEKSGSFRPPAAIISRHQLLPPLPSYTHVRRRSETVTTSTVPTSHEPSASSATPFNIKLEPGTADFDLAIPSSFVNNNANSGSGSSSNAGNSCSSSSNSNVILRQFLQDTSFQSKFNLKPFDLGGGLSGFLSAPAAEEKQAADPHTPPPLTAKLEAVDSGASSGGLLEAVDSGASSGGLLEVKIEPVLDLAVQQVQKDIDTTCEMLTISKGKLAFIFFCSSVKKFLFNRNFVIICKLQ